MNLDEARASFETVQALQDAVRADPLIGYTLLPHQAEFHLSTALVRALILANQDGKSHAIGAEVVWHARGNWPDWLRTGQRVPVRRVRSNLQGDPSRAAGRDRVLGTDDTVIVLEDWSHRFPRRHLPDRPTKIRLIVPSYKVCSGIVDKIMEMLPPGTFKAAKNAAKVWAHWEVEHVSKLGTSLIELVSDEGGELTGEGWVGDLYVIDEPSSHQRYVAHERGLMARDGKTIMALTPLEGSAWIKESVYDRAMAGDPDHAVWTRSIWCNCDENGGFRARRRILKFLSEEKNPARRKARESGEFLHIGGVVFPEFDHEVHVFESREAWGSERWWAEAQHWLIHDPHPRRSPVTLLLAVGSDDRICVCGELPGFHEDGSPYVYRDAQSDPQSVEVWHTRVETELLRPRGIPEDSIVDELVDPRGARQEWGGPGGVAFGGQSWIDRWNDQGHAARPAPVMRRTTRGEIADGIDLLRSWLLWDAEQPTGPGNCPRLGVLRECHNTVWAMSNWRYTETGATDEKMASEDRYADQGKDHVDCLRYAAFADPQWQPWEALGHAGEAVPSSITGY